jgi:hypothetical protein
MAITATIDNATGSHWISTEYGSGGPLSSEELFPTLVVEGVPRVGTVTVKMHVRRYVDSEKRWGSWMIMLNDYPSNGIGPATAKLIREACIPVVEAWLASPAYAEARREAIGWTCVRLIRDNGQYGIDTLREQVLRHFDELSEAQTDALTRAMNALSEAQALLETVPKL